MKMVIHDLKPEDFESLSVGAGEDTVVISDDGTIRNCIGCFGCWLKTPGVCVLKDGYNTMGELLSKCGEVVIVSKCLYGCYSSFVRNVLDRCLPYLLPYFVYINGETHHKKRYANDITSLTVHFYGNDVSEREKETAKALAEANGVNFYASRVTTHFHTDIQSIRGVI